MRPRIFIMIMAALAGLLLASAPARAAGTGAACAAYVYEADRGRDLCARFAGRGDVDCPEVGARVRLLTGADPWRLSQGSDDGIGCENEAGAPPPVTRPTTPPAETTPPTKAPATTRPANTSAAASASASASATRTRTRPATSAPVAHPVTDDGPTLPVTGPAAPVLAGAGVAVLAAGVLLALAVRRRRTRFEA